MKTSAGHHPSKLSLLEMGSSATTRFVTEKEQFKGSRAGITVAGARRAEGTCRGPGATTASGSMTHGCCGSPNCPRRCACKVREDSPGSESVLSEAVWAGDALRQGTLGEH